MIATDGCLAADGVYPVCGVGSCSEGKRRGQHDLLAAVEAEIVSPAIAVRIATRHRRR